MGIAVSIEEGYPDRSQVGITREHIVTEFGTTAELMSMISREARTTLEISHPACNGGEPSEVPVPPNFGLSAWRMEGFTKYFGGRLPVISTIDRRKISTIMAMSWDTDILQPLPIWRWTEWGKGFPYDDESALVDLIIVQYHLYYTSYFGMSGSPALFVTPVMRYFASEVDAVLHEEWYRGMPE